MENVSSSCFIFYAQNVQESASQSKMEEKLILVVIAHLSTYAAELLDDYCIRKDLNCYESN